MLRRQEGKEVTDQSSSNDIDWEELQKKAYGELRLSPDIFWRMTYKEFMLAYEGHRYSLEHGTYNAWLCAKLSRAEKIPSLNKVLGKGPTKKEIEDQEDIMEFMWKQNSGTD